ncbi:hypothetical protein GCM10022221_40270 [Actinocorallia aurea]
MAMAKKNARLIDVGEPAFRWRIPRRPTYAQGLGKSPLTFVLERGRQPGQGRPAFALSLDDRALPR